MVVILAPNAEVTTCQKDSNKISTLFAKKIKGPIALSWEITSCIQMDAPIANHAAIINEFTLHFLSKVDYDALQADIKNEAAILSKSNSEASIKLDGQTRIKGDLQKKTITGEFKRPGKINLNVPSWQNSHVITLRFDDEKYVKLWLDFENKLFNNLDQDPSEPTYGKPIPTCNICGRIKCHNGSSAAFRLAGIPVRSWEREFMCGWCMTEFAGRAGEIKRELGHPSVSNEFLRIRCEALLKIAESGLDDPLAIAAAKTYLGMILNTRESLELLENARQFLRRYKEPDFRDENSDEVTFIKEMESLFRLNSLTLSKLYDIYKKFDETIIVLNDLLAYYKRELNQRKVTETEALIGMTYVKAGNLDKAKQTFIASLDGLDRQSTNPLFSLIPLVEILVEQKNKEGLKKYGRELRMWTSIVPDLERQIQPLIDAAERVLGEKFV